MCLGIKYVFSKHSLSDEMWIDANVSSLAYAELYLTVAALVRHFDFELVNSSIENITPYRDYILSFDKGYKFGVDFRVTNVLQ